MSLNPHRQEWGIMTDKRRREQLCVCVYVREKERWHFPQTAWIEAKSGSVWVKVVNVTLMNATLALAGSVSCQCVMSPNEGELPVPLSPGLSPLMSFWINQCWWPPISWPVLYPFSVHLSPHALLHSYPSPGLVTLPRNEPSRPPYIIFQHSLSPEYLFVGQSAFAMFEDSDIQISCDRHCCCCLMLRLRLCVWKNER